MQVGQGRCSRRRHAVAGMVLLFLAGCAGRLDRALLADHNPAVHSTNPDTDYCIHCPDVLAAIVQEHGYEQPVDLDGRILVGKDIAVRVEGLKPVEASLRIAEQLGVDPACVEVHVIAFNSQKVYLHGEVAGQQRTVPYQGPETVLELLQRVGGITHDAASGNVQVVRPNVADGRAPEVFHVDLEAILRRGDQTTNVRLEPFDQVYVGQTRGHCLKSCLPPWLRAMCNMEE